MAKVFVSYSRKDIEFAKRLTAELQKSDLDFWIDWEGIPPTVNWWREIEKGIEEADVFIFLISPDSTRSKVCGQEIEVAVKNAKRIIPLVVRDIKGEEAPKQLSHLNWIFFRPIDDFDAGVNKLITAIETDYEWAATHRRLQVKGLDWERNNKESGFLLRGADLLDAEQDLATNTSKDPHPTDLQREYVFESRKATDRQRRTTTTIAIGGVVTLAILATVAVVMAFQATQQAEIARAGELAAQTQLMLSSNLGHSLLLGIESFRERDTAQARSALLSAASISPQLEQFLIGNTRPISLLNQSIASTAFSSDGKLFAAGKLDFQDHSITLWDLSQRDPIGQLIGHAGTVVSMAFSPDGKTLVSGSADENIILWDMATLQPIGEPFIGHKDTVESVAFSPDGMTIASGGDDGEIILWDVEAHQAIGEPLAGHTFDVNSLEFSRDGRTLGSGGGDGQIILWDLTSRPPIGSPLTVKIGTINSVAFSPDGTLIAYSGSDRVVYLLSMYSHELIGQLRGHTNDILSVAFSPDGGTLASGGYDKNVMLWDVTALQGKVLFGHTQHVNQVSFEEDGKLLTSSLDGAVIKWDTATRHPLSQTLATYEYGIVDMALDRNNKFLATKGWDEIINIWDAPRLKDTNSTSGQPVHQIIMQNPGDITSNLAFSPDGKTLAFGKCNQIKDDNSQSACIRGEVILWDTRAHQPVGQPLVGHTGDVTHVTFSPNGKILVSGSNDGTLILWDTTTREPIRQPLKVHTWGISSIAFSPDGSIFALSSILGADIFLWNVSDLLNKSSKDDQPSGELLEHEAEIRIIAFSPDGQTLASGSDDGMIILWDVKNRQPRGQLTGHEVIVTSVAFSPDGKTLASGSLYGQLILWDIAIHQMVGQPLIGHDQDVTGVAFDADGKTLVSTGQDGRIVLWDIDPESWIAKSCQRVGRNFARAEWAKYFPNEGYPKDPKDATCPEWPLEKEGTATATPIP